jgi:hypothetical protein
MLPFALDSWQENWFSTHLLDNNDHLSKLDPRTAAMFSPRFRQYFTGSL